MKFSPVPIFQFYINVKFFTGQVSKGAFRDDKGVSWAPRVQRHIKSSWGIFYIAWASARAIFNAFISSLMSRSRWQCDFFFPMAWGFIGTHDFFRVKKPWIFCPCLFYDFSMSPNKQPITVKRTADFEIQAKHGGVQALPGRRRRNF